MKNKCAEMTGDEGKVQARTLDKKSPSPYIIPFSALCMFSLFRIPR